MESVWSSFVKHFSCVILKELLKIVKHKIMSLAIRTATLCKICTIINQTKK